MEETIIVVPGNPDERGQVAIWDESRPHPSHCWARAGLHIFHFKNVNYFVQIESANACINMVKAINIQKIPPQRSKTEWGWGKRWPGQR